MVIVDDGADCVADLVPADPWIRYVRLPERKTVGAKRNLACEQARGERVVHGDDDDCRRRGGCAARSRRSRPWTSTWRV